MLVALFVFGIGSFAGADPLYANERVSISSNSGQGNNYSYMPSISADGRFVAYYSAANNLFAGDTNGRGDVFVYDRLLGINTLVSISSNGVQGNGESSEVSLSADGRYVSFSSTANNLVDGDTNGYMDIFVHDCQTGLTKRVSLSSNGIQGNGRSAYSSISNDGQTIAFYSYANNLVTSDTNAKDDVFVRDLVNGVTSRVSVTSAGVQGNNTSSYPSISGDGRYVAFQSLAGNLASGDLNGVEDIFVYDRQTGQTIPVSGSSTIQGNGKSLYPVISKDGSSVVFQSLASNLVVGDTNGVEDIFSRNTSTGEIKRISLSSAGSQSNGRSLSPSTNDNGRYITYRSGASNLVDGDTNGYWDIFLFDQLTGLTTRVSVTDSGLEANNSSSGCTISADGRFAAISSVASNLVPGDTNNWTDVFVYSLGN